MALCPPARCGCAIVSRSVHIRGFAHSPADLGTYYHTLNLEQPLPTGGARPQGLEVYSSLTVPIIEPPAECIQFTDLFERADGAIGPDWTSISAQIAGPDDDLEIVTGAAVNPTAGTYAAVVHTDTTPGDQYIDIEIGAWQHASGGGVSFFLFTQVADPTAPIDGYGMRWIGDRTLSGTPRAGQIVDGSLALPVVGYVEPAATFHMRLETTLGGTLHRVYVDDELINEETTAAIAGDYVGFGMFWSGTGTSPRIGSVTGGCYVDPCPTTHDRIYFTDPFDGTGPLDVAWTTIPWAASPPQLESGAATLPTSAVTHTDAHLRPYGAASAPDAPNPPPNFTVLMHIAGPYEYSYLAAVFWRGRDLQSELGTKRLGVRQEGGQWVVRRGRGDWTPDQSYGGTDQYDGGIAYNYENTANDDVLVWTQGPLTTWTGGPRPTGDWEWLAISIPGGGGARARSWGSVDGTTWTMLFEYGSTYPAADPKTMEDWPVWIGRSFYQGGGVFTGNENVFPLDYPIDYFGGRIRAVEMRAGVDPNTVPTGTDRRFLDGKRGYAETPDAPDLTITGDTVITWRVKWRGSSPSYSQVLIDKADLNATGITGGITGFSWEVDTNSTTWSLYTSASTGTGTTRRLERSATWPLTTYGESSPDVYFGVIYRSTTGGATPRRTAQWIRSTDGGTTWVNYGTPSSLTPIVGLWESAAPLRIGGQATWDGPLYPGSEPNPGYPFDGEIYWVEARTGTTPNAGTIIWRFDVTEVPDGATAWTDPRGRPWTLVPRQGYRYYKTWDAEDVVDTRPPDGTTLWRFDVDDADGDTAWTDPRGLEWSLTEAGAVTTVDDARGGAYRSEEWTDDHYIEVVVDAATLGHLELYTSLNPDNAWSAVGTLDRWKTDDRRLAVAVGEVTGGHNAMTSGVFYLPAEGPVRVRLEQFRYAWLEDYGPDPEDIPWRYYYWEETQVSLYVDDELIDYSWVDYDDNEAADGESYIWPLVEGTIVRRTGQQVGFAVDDNTRVLSVEGGEKGVVTAPGDVGWPDTPPLVIPPEQATFWFHDFCTYDPSTTDCDDLFVVYDGVEVVGWTDLNGETATRAATGVSPYAVYPSFNFRGLPESVLTRPDVDLTTLVDPCGNAMVFFYGAWTTDYANPVWDYAGTPPGYVAVPYHAGRGLFQAGTTGNGVGAWIDDAGYLTVEIAGATLSAPDRQFYNRSGRYAAYRHGAEMRLYRSGVLIAQRSDAAGTITGTGDLTLGASDGAPYGGYLDEVVIVAGYDDEYFRAQMRWQQDYHGGNRLWYPDEIDGLVAWWAHASGPDKSWVGNRQAAVGYPGGGPSRSIMSSWNDRSPNAWHLTSTNCAYLTDVIVNSAFSDDMVVVDDELYSNDVAVAQPFTLCWAEVAYTKLTDNYVDSVGAPPTSYGLVDTTDHGIRIWVTDTDTLHIDAGVHVTLPGILPATQPLLPGPYFSSSAFPHTLTVIFDGADSKLWIDSSLVFEGDFGSNDLNGIRFDSVDLNVDEPVDCTDVLTEPFNNFTDAPWTLTGTTATIVAGRTGTAASFPSSSVATYTIPPASESDAITFGCAFSSSSLGSGYKLIDFGSDAGATWHNELWWTSGTLTVKRSSVTIGASTTGLIVANTWYYIEIKLKLHDTAGTLEVKLNGSTIIGPLSSLDTKNLGTKTTYDRVRLFSTFATTKYDDLYLSTGAGCTFQGDPEA